MILICMMICMIQSSDPRTQEIVASNKTIVQWTMFAWMKCNKTVPLCATKPVNIKEWSSRRFSTSHNLNNMQSNKIFFFTNLDSIKSWSHYDNWWWYMQTCIKKIAVILFLVCMNLRLKICKLSDRSTVFFKLQGHHHRIYNEGLNTACLLDWNTQIFGYCSLFSFSCHGSFFF